MATPSVRNNIPTSSAKDSVTSGPLSKWLIAGDKASGSGEQPLLSEMKESKVYFHGGDNNVIKKKLVPTAKKTEEKGVLPVGPMVTLGWEPKDYSALLKKLYR